MAKARITSNAGEGLYGIELEYDSTDLDSQIEALRQQLIGIEQQLLDAQVAVIEAEAARDALANDLDAAIDAYAAGGESEPVIAATGALAEAVSALNVARFKAQRISGTKLSLAARKTFLENIIVGSQAGASDLVWCADYTDDLAAGAIVPVAVPPGEISAAPWVILPQQHPDGYGGSYDRALHGQLVPRMSMTPAATFFNWAMLPGWQRWMPTHRIGTLTFVDTENDTCNVTIDTARSSANPYPFTRGLNVNLAESTATMLEGVPIRYMTCNAAVFEAGDRVLVRFKNSTAASAGVKNWWEPEVIGFVSNPRECDIFYAAIGENSRFGTGTEQYIDGPLVCFSGGATCTRGWTHTEAMSNSGSFEFFGDIFDEKEPENGAFSASSSWGWQRDVSVGGTGVGEFFIYDDDIDYSASAQITTPAGHTITMLSFTGTHDVVEHSNQEAVMQEKTASHSLISRVIQSATADGSRWFATVEKSIVSYSNGIGTNTRHQYDVVGIDGVEYVYDERNLSTSINVDQFSEENNLSTYVLSINSPIARPPGLFITSGAAGGGIQTQSVPVLNKFNTPITLTDRQKTILRDARSGNLPILSI